MASQAENQKSIRENAKRILGPNPASDFERYWDAIVGGKVGWAVLRLAPIERPAYQARFLGDMNAHGELVMEEFTFGRTGVISAAVRTTVSVNEIFEPGGVEERMQAQLDTPLANPGMQDYARLAEILQQGPAAETPGAGQ